MSDDIKHAPKQLNTPIHANKLTDIFPSSGLASKTALPKLEQTHTFIKNLSRVMAQGIKELSELNPNFSAEHLENRCTQLSNSLSHINNPLAFWQLTYDLGVHEPIPDAVKVPFPSQAARGTIFSFAELRGAMTLASIAETPALCISWLGFFEQLSQQHARQFIVWLITHHYLLLFNTLLKLLATHEEQMNLCRFIEESDADSWENFFQETPAERQVELLKSGKTKNILAIIERPASPEQERRQSKQRLVFSKESLNELKKNLKAKAASYQQSYVQQAALQPPNTPISFAKTEKNSLDQAALSTAIVFLPPYAVALLTDHYNELPPNIAEFFDSDDLDNFEQLHDIFQSIAEQCIPTLILGEEGCDNQQVAQKLHQQPHTNDTNFCTIEARQYAGNNGLAPNSTLLINHVEELPLHFQRSLLRDFDDSFHAQQIRFIATNPRDLSSLTRSGKFDEDFYNQISTIKITLPPLRRRKQDVPKLCRYFLFKLGQVANTTAPELDERALQALCNYGWPGNLQELKNMMQEAFEQASDDIIDLKLLKSISPQLDASDIERLRLATQLQDGMFILR